MTLLSGLVLLVISPITWCHSERQRERSGHFPVWEEGIAKEKGVTLAGGNGVGEERQVYGRRLTEDDGAG